MSNQHPFLHPPKAATTFLGCFLEGADQDPILGDLVEMYQDKAVQNHTLLTGKIWFWRQIVFSIIPFLWIRLGRFAGHMWFPLRSRNNLGGAIVGYYFAAVLLGLFLQLPLFFSAILATPSRMSGIGISNSLLVLGSKCIESASQNQYVFRRSWENTVVAAILILICMLILRKTNGWPGIVAGYLIIASSSYRLMPLIISRLAPGNGWWLDERLDQPGLSAFRIPLILLCAVPVFAGNYYAFHRLSLSDACCSPVVRLRRFLNRFLLPTAFVSLLFETGFLRHWNPWLVEYRVVALLPVFVIGCLAAFLSGWTATSTDNV